MTEANAPAYPVTYVESKELCQSNIDKVNTVCHQCGGKLSPIETVDNAGKPTFWAGCEACSVFTWGVPELCYRAAVELVDNRYHRHYSHLKSPDGKDEGYKKYYRNAQIGGTSVFVSQIQQLLSELSKPQP